MKHTSKILGSYYSLAVRRFQTILGGGLRIFPHFRGGLRLANHGTVTENHCVFARFSVFMHFHGRITVLEVAVSRPYIDRIARSLILMII